MTHHSQFFPNKEKAPSFIEKKILAFQLRKVRHLVRNTFFDLVIDWSKTLSLTTDDMSLIFQHFEFLLNARFKYFPANVIDDEDILSFAFSLLTERKKLLNDDGLRSLEFFNFEEHIKNYDFLRDEEILEKYLWIVSDTKSISDSEREYVLNNPSKVLFENDEWKLILSSFWPMKVFGEKTRWPVSRIYYPHNLTHQSFVVLFHKNSDRKFLKTGDNKWLDKDGTLVGVTVTFGESGVEVTIDYPGSLE